MKNVSIIILLLLNLNIASGQEVAVEVSVWEFFIEEHILKEILIVRSNEISLTTGKWTDVDRRYNLPRFQNAMEYIVLNNRTDLLGSLGEISSYYSYLDTQPLIADAKIKWQGEAAKVTFALQAVPIAMVIAYFTGTLYAELAGMANQDDEISKEVKKILEEGISPQGLDFMDGTASKKVCADVTKKYFSPIIQGKLKVTDPFKFDADILYREQYEILQPNYYSKFNDFDNALIVSWFSNLYPMTTRDLKMPLNRLIIGLDEMGYPENKINDYTSKIK
jgi:hypothetical protein